jgi:DNA topoisomerase-3
LNYEYETLFLTEKDSQVQALSVVVGAEYAGKWKPAYNRAEKIVLVPLQGHVLTGLEPSEYDPRLGEFGEDSIYVFPEDYKLKPNERSKNILDTAVAHIKKAKKIIIATDFDNEGASIAMNVIRYAGAEDRVERMLPMGSTHPDELRHAIDNPINIPYIRMADTGKARAFIDWAEGMSLSRALSFYLGDKNKVKLNFGGVKTPLIYMVVERDNAFEAHKMSYFWTISGMLGDVPVKVKQKLITKDKKGKDVEVLEEKFESEQEAKAALDYLNSKVSKIGSLTRRQSKASPPKLYELAGLQGDMSKKFKVRPSGTMDLAQKLYDFPISLQTYPRTDVPYLKESEYVDVKPILTKLGKSGVIEQSIIDNILSGSIPKRSSTFNDKEVVAHGAIVPTLKGDLNKFLPKMDKMERAVFDFVAMRYVANFMEDNEFIAVNGETEEDNKLVLTFGENIPTKAGWKEIYEKGIAEKISSYEKIIPDSLKKGDVLQFKSGKIIRNETKPKPQFTMDTLLKAMENVSTLFPESPEIKEFLGDSGIGTNATRAAIIDNVMSEDFNKGAPWLIEEKGVIKSTQKARDFVKVLPTELVSPIKRAMLSKKLRMIEKGDLSSKQLVDEYRLEVRRNIDIIIDIYKKSGSIAANGLKKEIISLGECPVCGGDIHEKEKVFLCSNAKFKKSESGEWTNEGCEYKIFKTGLEKLGKKQISAKEVSDMLHKGVKIVSLKSAKTGKAYNGNMVVDKKWGVKIDFTSK